VNALALANAVLEGEDPKEFLRRSSQHITQGLKPFINAYFEAMLWSTNLSPFGQCPMCGEEKVLDRWDEACDPVCSDCSDREPNHEPPADSNYDFSDISDELRRESIDDCQKFCRENAVDLSAVDEIEGWNAMEMAGHDFWLTRAGHGVGFNDRDDWPDDVRERLDDAARRYGDVYIYVGDDGKIHV